MNALVLAIAAATAHASAVPSTYTEAVSAVQLPSEDGPRYGIPANMGVGDEVVVAGETGTISRYRTRRIQGVRVPVAQISLPGGDTVWARPLADMVTAQPPPPAAEGWFADEDPSSNILVIPREVRAGSEVQVDGDALTVVAVARNLESNDVVVVEDDDGERRSLRVWWTW